VRIYDWIYENRVKTLHQNYGYVFGNSDKYIDRFMESVYSNSNTFIRYSEFHASYEAIIRQLPQKTVTILDIHI